MVSDFFIPIYESSFEKSKKSKLISPIQKKAEIIFCEREFVDWLRNKFGKKLTGGSYPKYCTPKYFQLFIREFNTFKKKKEFKKKRDIIYQQLFQDSKFPPITKHEYDVDIVEAYFKTKQLLETQFTDEQLKTKKEYLNGFLHPIQYYCAKKQMPIERVLQSKYPIVFDNSAHNFQAYLGRTLIAFDVNKIEAILSYQNALWKGEGMFASFVEHLVYSFVTHNSQFDNNIRLAKIMKWVEKNRVFLPHDAPFDEKEKGPTLKYGEKTESLITFHYWPYQEEKLTTLYNLLFENGNIEKCDYFSENFKTYSNLPKGIIWKTKNIQLMFLMFLVYEKKVQYKSMPIHNIALKLFQGQQTTFSSNGLNTSLLQAKAYFEEKKKLSLGLQPIQDIIDKLALY